jgi:tRNA1(Val) A37 N6-methylase TrmN6
MDAGPAAPGKGTTDDAFLGGAVRALQPERGFRAGLDSVLLAAAVQATGHVAELGMGAGVASLCLLRRCPDIRVTGIEIDSGLAALARANAERNGFAARMTVLTADVMRLPRDVPRQAFDAVMTNPPFLLAGEATAGPDAGKARAIAHDAEAEAAWFKAALAVLRPKGVLTVIHRADALGRVLSYLSPGTGGVRVLPLHPAEGAAATRIIVTAAKGSRAPLAVAQGLVLHEPGGGFTLAIQRILREGAALSTSP